MKILIPSKGRADAISTHRLFDGVAPYSIVVHTEEEAAQYRRNVTVPPDALLVSGAEFRVGAQRQWILDHLIEYGEWFMMLDDNIEGFTAVSEDLYPKEYVNVKQSPKSFKDKFSVPISTELFLTLVQETIAKANEWGARYAGFASNPNFFFREKKWRPVGYVLSKIALVRKSGIGYDPKVQAMDDYDFTAANLLKFGTVCINNFVSSQYRHYQQGGIGTYEDRLPKKIADCKYLMQKYPGLFRYKRKATAHPEAELQIRFTSTDQVYRWKHALQTQISRQPA